MTLIEHIRNEWHVLRSAPFTFILLLVLGAASGYRLAEWYDAKKIGDQEGQIRRYRVAMNIDQASPSALVELTNEELQAKAETTAGVIRGICFDYQQKDQLLARQLKDQKIVPGSPRALASWKPMAAEFVDRFDKDAKFDFTNVDGELRKRLGPGGINDVVMAPELPFNIGTLLSNEFESLYLCKYADELDELAKRLPAGR